MPEPRTCSRCGAALPADAPGGHCLQCLLQFGLATDETAAPSGTIQVPLASTGSPAEKPGDRIGHYKLLQQIGEGGCGVVYMAEQNEPVRRRVALKIIKLGMDTRQVIARFEAERQALAMMDHPNIAKVFDAGATDCGARLSPAAARPLADARESSSPHPSPDEAAAAEDSRAPYLSAGRQYFVMELVRGIKITSYCDQQKLSTRERLDLFIQVCQAIQHAHQKGIIHRDLKPSNILVTEQDGAPMPKIIDFGIAKATTDQRLTDKTLFTAFEQFIGTPTYMSPEQAGLGGLDIDTRSDIYSLGVLLYELLTGQPPFDSAQFSRSALDEILRIIREQEPPRPSARLTTLTEQELTTVAQRRQTEAAKLPYLLRGDLDWIVTKAMEKDRRRRYETANGLARDLQRFLGNEPVVARPPSNIYRFQKLARRNKLAFAAGAMVIVALSLGLGISTWSLIKERHARQRAANEAAKSQQVATFLQDMLQGVGPSVARGRDTTMLREILDKTAQRVTNDLHKQPEVEAELLSIIGRVYVELGEDQKAEQMYREALTIRRKFFGHQDPAVAELLAHLCYTLWRQTDKRAEAEESGREAVALYRILQGKRTGIEDSKMAYALDQLSAILRRGGKLTEAEAAAREALALAGTNANPSRASALGELAEVLFVDGKPAEAEPLLREALAIRQAIGRDSQGASVLVEVLAQVLAAEGKFEEAEALIREEISSEKQSNYQDALVHSLRILGVVLCLPGKLPDAEAVLREDLEMMIKEFGKGHRLYATVLTDLGDNLQQQGKFAESAVLLREALDLHRQGRQGARLGPTSCVRRLVGVLMADDKPAAVGHLCNELNSGSSTNVRLAAIAMWARGDFFARRGRWSEAEADLARALELNPGSPTWHRVAAVLVQHGKLDAYKAHCREGLERFRNTTNSENAQRIAMSCLVLSGSGADLEVVNEMVNAAAATDTNAFSSVPFLVAKGLAEFRQGHFANAADWLKKALARPAETQWSWGSWIPVQAWAILAMAQWQLREGNIAQVSLAKAMEIERRESVKLWAADFGNDPTDRVFAQSLLRQAQALIERKNE